MAAPSAAKCDIYNLTTIPPWELNFTKGTAYCSFNNPVYLPNVGAACCLSNSTLQVFNNCTQFCAVDASIPDSPHNFTDCLNKTVPDGQLPAFQCDVVKTGAANGASGMDPVASLCAMLFTGMAVLAWIV